jgi:hypothetical protein
MEKAKAKAASDAAGMAGPGRGGWQQEIPLSLPIAPGSFLDRVVGGVIDNATLSPRERILRDLRALSPEERTQLLGEMAARADDPRTKELKALTEEAWR